ncbi:MAG: 30S ribosomal protein S20 [Verrucomicrobia bacterium]|nr:30S ribosomal protein S20 [Verrucomicrobiota bacterium]
MANTRSALKRVRQNKVRNARNRALKSRIKGARKALVAALDSGNGSDAESRYREYISIVDRSVKANLSHRNSSSRVKAIFSSRVKVLNS